MHLHFPDGTVLAVAQSGPDFLILRQPATRPPGEAILVVHVDDSITRFPSWLPAGIDGCHVSGEPLPSTRQSPWAIHFCADS